MPRRWFESSSPYQLKMSRKHIPLEQRKISATISMPYPLWLMKQEKGSRHMVDLIMLGLWAKKVGVNELSLNKLRHDFEEKIMRLQRIIDNGNK